ncbi:acetyl/propionyl/methylcrotonyl-CoA carboxylase subunit alpha [Fluviispira sanaruensis]|uniref:Acetyl/propionyl/methylcrotonyl-CoA carboxylase subunit alpha n=1 Tax=Fluviispira sanaruensis TaxID=2493639 RepID=A0A4P2VN88_FLUSA|nr:biotin carboxylase N-terminal domain-containing protein [Fluviispira sanaruensis]BBH53019.1 acetyl/propionyl/methylcrotonyl-CoA carboxylase subunit alpha [Fluviispira sanaruensis]
MKKLLIANRGEISRRIMKAAKERGFIVAVIATQEDSDSLICQEVDHVIEVSNFLNAEEIVEKAKSWGANFIHPGYGFLSENAAFAELVENANISFIGSTSQNIKMMGSKETAKRIAQKSNVPTLDALFSSDLKKIPADKWENELKNRKIFSPFLVKASGGGGGRGMRIVDDVHELPQAIKRASEEAKASFNDGTVFVERYLKNPRHIEIQIFGDGKGGGVFFGERECSLQRRHQKVIEEAPSTQVNEQLRAEMGKASLALVKETAYKGAGTLEFLLDDAGRFYFLEMNTRLQVEHPVTENVYKIDLVHAQIDLAEGIWPNNFPDPNHFHLLSPQAVSIEARILAEDPRNQFLPTPGQILFYKEPEGEGIRVDTGVTEGSRINSNFDSLIAKLIVTAPTRALAVQKLKNALEDFSIFGFTTNISFLHSIVMQKDFLLGHESTHWIANNIETLTRYNLPQNLIEVFQYKKFREQLSNMLRGGRISTHINNVFLNQGKNLHNVNAKLDANSDLDFIITKSHEKNKFFVSGDSISKILKEKREHKEKEIYSDLFQYLSHKSQYKNDIKIPFSAIKTSHNEMQVNLFGEYLKLDCPYYNESRIHKSAKGSGEIRAPMAGKVFEVLVSEGQDISAGQVLFIVESMKMQLEVKSAEKGKVTEIFVKQGQILSGTDVMAMVHSNL